MNKENILRYILVIAIIVNIAILLIIDGPWWSFLCFPLLFFSIFLLYLITATILIPYFSNEKNRYSSKLKRIAVVLIIILIAYLLFPFFMIGMTHLKSEANRPVLDELVENLIKNAETNEEKTLLILQWFDEDAKNIFDNYDLQYRQGKLILSIPFWNLKIFSSEPHIGFRLPNDRDSLWILTSRYGHCGEFSLIFRDMANAANLTVRKVVCIGEDHVWNEVLINESWITVDATDVCFPNRTGYDLPNDFMEQKRDSHNISYVYAEYPDWTTEDITYRYTNLTNITIQAIESNGKPVSDVKIRLLSSNYGHNKETELTKITNEIGQCTFIIGGGDYTFIAEKDGVIPFSGEISGKYYENQSYNVDVFLGANWVRVILLLAVGIFIIGVILYIGFYRRKK